MYVRKITATPSSVALRHPGYLQAQDDLIHET